jgi:hypothetical protein
MAFWMNGAWALWNCYFAAYVVRHTLAMRQRRDDHRFDEAMPIDVGVHHAGARDVIPAMTSDLNAAGLAFRATCRVEEGTKVSIVLPLGGQRVATMGRVRHVERHQATHGDLFMHGVSFDELPVDARDAIELYCTQHSMALWRMRYRQSIDIVRLAGEMMSNLRGARRHLIGLPAIVRTVGGEGDDRGELTRTLVLEQLGPSGAGLIGDVPIVPGTRITFTVPGSSLSGAGVVRHVQTLETPVAVLFSMGVELDGARRTVRRRFWHRPNLALDAARANEPTARAS